MLNGTSISLASSLALYIRAGAVTIVLQREAEKKKKFSFVCKLISFIT